MRGRVAERTFGMDGLTDLNRAAEILAGPPDYLPPPADVAEALVAVRAALTGSDRWPPGLRDRASEVVLALFRHGPPSEAAWRMSSAEVRAFAALMIGLARDAAEARDAAVRRRDGAGATAASRG